MWELKDTTNPYGRVIFLRKTFYSQVIDKEMMEKDLQSQAGISWTSVTKLSKGENVGMEVLMKICTALDCNIGDIVEFVKGEEDLSKVC